MRRISSVARVARYVASGLLAWPASARRRDRASLLAALEEELASAARRGRVSLILCALAEWSTLVRTGVGLRLRAIARSVRPTGAAPGGWTREWRQDVRLAARALRRAPGFTVVAVGTLALGVGANAAVFQMVERVLLRPPPYARPDRLVLVWATRAAGARHQPVAAPDAAAVAERAGVLAGLTFTTRTRDCTLASEPSSTPWHCRRATVTPDFFRVLGVPPARGRDFSQDVAVPDTAAVMISDAVWRRAFAADPDVVGRTILLDGRPVVVLGIAPPGFRLELPPDAGIGTEADVWVPVPGPLASLARADGRLVDQDSDDTGAVIARLADDVRLDRARVGLARVAAELRVQVPGYATAGFGLEMEPLHADATAYARPLLVALLGGAAGLLLVSCLSLAVLFVARGMQRERDRAVRVALGATGWRLLRARLVERALVLLLGAAAALPVARGAAYALRRGLPPSLARLSSAPDAYPWLTVTFVAVATVVLGALLSLVTVVRSAGPRRGRLAARLLRGAPGRARSREALVVGEVAMSVILVLGAGLLLRTAGALRGVDPGFRADGALVFDASLRVPGAYAGPSERARLVRAIEDAVAGVPGVRGVGLTGALPLSGRHWTQPWGRPGEPAQAWGSRRADFRMVTSGYFAAVGTRLLEGRAFTPDEDLDERGRVVVVDATLAGRIAPGGSALGATIGIPLDGRAVEATVVGVVEPVRYDDLAAPPREAIYVPYRQEASRDVSFVVRTELDPASLAPAVRRAALDVEPRLALWAMQPMSAYVEVALAPTRFGLGLVGTYAALALLATALGLCGVIAWDVERRTRELGLRLAVGASTARLRASVVARGLRLGALGVALGGVGGAAATADMRRLVYGVGAADPAAWIGTVGVVVAVTLVASWLPARRIGRLDPASALRSE